MLIRRYSLLLLAIAIAGCSSKTATTEKTGWQKPVSEKAPFEKFSFRISGSGIPSQGKPYDMFLMDTNQMMGVHTTSRGKDGKFHTLNGLAQLEPKDYDTLRQLILKGKLYAIDSNDVTQQCAGDELYQLDIVPLAAITPVRLEFNACATDYNLLLQPQRRYFAMLIAWFERMRTKYRPAEPQ